MRRILLVEDEAALVTVLTDRLEAEGYAVASTSTGDQVERLMREGGVDLLVLDWMLPGRSGLEICRSLRAAGSTVPILMLTARGELADKVTGLRVGADDYLSKPFEMVELLARVEALLRRAPADALAPPRAFGLVTVEPASGQVLKGGVPVELSAKELDLLLYMLEHPGEVLSRQRLLTEVWGFLRPPLTRTVDVHVASLRQKLEADPRRPRHIRTVHGAGYRFVH